MKRIRFSKGGFIVFGRKKLDSEVESALKILEKERDASTKQFNEALQLIIKKGRTTEDKKQLVLRRLEKIAEESERKISSWKKLKPEFRPHPLTTAYESEFQSRIRSTISFLKGELVTFKNW